jgi:hypothetical protein
MDVWAPIILLGAVVVGFAVLFGFVVQKLSNHGDRVRSRKAAKEWEKTKDIETRGQYRDRMTMEAALRNTQQSAPPATPTSLSTRLAQLDAAMQAGQINQQEYAKARAAILASP